MTEGVVTFDCVRQRVLDALESIDLTTLEEADVYLVRDLYGRVRIIADERTSESGQHALEDLATRLNHVLGAHVHAPERLLLRLDTSEFHVLGPSATRISNRVFWVDRLVTNAGWWTVDALGLRLGSRPHRYTLYSIKGGVGRSTTAALLAWHLARQGERVLVVDLDMESPGLGSAVLDQGKHPEFGTVDWFVEDLVGQSIHVVERMTGTPAWAGDLEGTVTVVPAHGRDPGEYLAKLGRVYLEANMLWTERINNMIMKLEAAWQPTIVLIESRSGLHDIAAATVTDLGAHALLFATDSASSWIDYEMLFAHWREHDLASVMRERLSIVSALTPEIDTEVYLAQFAERSWHLFRDHLYDDVAPSSKGTFSFDLHEPSAPHSPIPIHWNRGLAAGSSLRMIDDTPVAMAYSRFFQSFDSQFRPAADQ